MLFVGLKGMWWVDRRGLCVRSGGGKEKDVFSLSSRVIYLFIYLCLVFFQAFCWRLVAQKELAKLKLAVVVVGLCARVPEHDAVALYDYIDVVRLFLNNCRQF